MPSRHLLNIKECKDIHQILLFIDLDKNNFQTERSFKLALKKTLKNIKVKLYGFPTILSTGGGYHIYQPLDSFVLEEIDIFSEFDNPSKQFLRFGKDYLTNNKADKSNNPSFKSCLLRIPFSYNSKFISNNASLENACVKIMEYWDGNRPSIKYLLRDFRRYLINQKIKELNQLNKRKKLDNKFSKNNNNTIFWIEKLFKMPISDFRKNSVNLILAPYLVNIKKLPCQYSFDILVQWLIECDSLVKLDFNSTSTVRYALNRAINKKILPIKLDTLKKMNIEMYNKIRI